MRQDLVLYTYSGGMKIVYLDGFAQMVPFQMANSHIVQVAQLETPRAFWDPNANREFEQVMCEPISRQTHELKCFHEINGEMLMRKPFESGVASHLIREEMQRAAFKQISEEFRIMVAKKEPAFFMKDLSLDNVHKLAEEFAKNFASEACGIEVRLSPYQKFFAIADPSDFRFYINQVEAYRVDRPFPVTEFRGKLVDHRPEKLVMGRYENLTYLNELSAQRMYTGGNNG